MALNSESLRPRLDQAEKRLFDALTEACSSDVQAANTGELIRIEEVLAIANEAAKEAISVRRRLGADEHAHDSNNESDIASDVASADAAPSDVTEPSSASTEAHREIEDDRGVRWMAFAVYPSRVTSGRTSPLPDAFQRGWLAFDSGMETRRLAPIPDGWHALSVDELRDLCGKAEIAPRRAMHRDHAPPEQSQ